MDREELEKLLKALDELISEKYFSNKSVVIFGANPPATFIINHLYKHGIEISYIIDNSEKKYMKDFMGLKIEKPSILGTLEKEKCVVLICSKYFNEMTEQSKSYGINDIKVLLELKDNEEKFIYKNYFEQKKESVYHGYNIYIDLKNEFPNKDIFISPYRPNGDVYIICTYLETFLKCKNKTFDDIVLVVMTKIAAHTAATFGVKNIKILSKESIDELCVLANLFPDEIHISNPHYSHIQLQKTIDGYLNYDFIDSFKSGMYGLKKNDPYITPIEINNENEIIQLFSENRLVPGKTVILSPHVYSLSQIHWRFWEILAEKLIELGYIVCTNCGNERELPVKNTIPLFFKFEDANKVCEIAGIFIAFRSGLCDIVANSKCKKIIIYPKESNAFCSLKTFFGMNADFYFKEDIFELENNHENNYLFVDKILNFLRIAEV